RPLRPTARSCIRPSRPSAPACRHRRFGARGPLLRSIPRSFGLVSICAACTGCRGGRRTPRVRRSSGSCARISSRGCTATSAWPSKKGCSSRDSCTATFQPAAPSKEIGRFTFARQPGGEHLSLADYLLEPQNGRMCDVVALQVVTVGTRAAERTEALQRAGEYSESYFLHGFSVQSAEALAEYAHRRIRRELGLDAERGKRYSWGYG